MYVPRAFQFTSVQNGCVGPSDLRVKVSLVNAAMPLIAALLQLVMDWFLPASGFVKDAFTNLLMAAR
jgi:hypothetical protein